MAHEPSENGDESGPGRFKFDRERGIFTPRDRRFLAGVLDDELSGEAKRQKRYRLRKRVRNALQDLHYLGAMDFKDTNAIGHEIYNDEDMESRFNGAVHELMNYFYDLYGREGFISLLEFALEWQEKTEHYGRTRQYVDVDVSIEIERGDQMTIEELAEQSSERELEPIEKIILQHAGGSGAYSPRHPELIRTVAECFYEEGADSDAGADWDSVAERVMEEADVTRAEATEALEDYCLLGFANTSGPGRVLKFTEDPPDDLLDD